MNKLFTQLIEKRGLNDDFLHPKYENLTKLKSVIKDTDKAVARVKKALQNKEKILIYGDYDVDGVTASTLMEEALILAGVKKEDIDIMLPDRFVDGYGMSSRLIERAKEQNATLIITVDCGSRNFDIIDELNVLKIDTIITDHHECEDTLPEAVAILNPKRKDIEDHDLANLAGVGVAFKFAEALRDAGLIKDGQEKWLLDLVLIGTVCDNMTLIGENRILCYYGIKVLEKTRRKGLIELMKNAGIKSIDANSIGFQIGPRLNAAGRLDTAELSLNLLRTKSSSEAAAYAAKLEQLNSARRTEQREALNEINKRGIIDGPVIIEAGKWHEGIIGIIAGRLLETYKKPSFVLTEVEGDIFKGSGRSFGDFSLANALEAVKGSIISGGGHAAAAGVKIARKDLYAFREKMTEYYNSLKLKDQTDFLKQHAELDVTDLKELSFELLENLKLLEPFGAGNEEPLFRLAGVDIVDIKHLGVDGKHLRIDVADKDNTIIKCVAFNAPEEWFLLAPDSKVNLVIHPVLNEFRGVRSVEARIVDIDKNFDF